MWTMKQSQDKKNKKMEKQYFEKVFLSCLAESEWVSINEKSININKYSINDDYCCKTPLRNSLPIDYETRKKQKISLLLFINCVFYIFSIAGVAFFQFQCIGLMNYLLAFNLRTKD